METFAFSMSEPRDRPNYYVAEDNVIDDSVFFDWLVADNYIRTGYAGELDVLAPEGYIFWVGLLVPVSERTEDEVRSAGNEDSAFWFDTRVRTAYRAEDKANTLLDGEVMKSVSHAELHALGIPEDRVLYFTID